MERRNEEHADHLFDIFFGGVERQKPHAALKFPPPTQTLQEATEAYAERKEHERFFGRRPASYYGWDDEDEGQEEEYCQGHPDNFGDRS